MKRLTAVEWLEQRLNVYFNKKLESSLWKIKAKFEQAKNIEKQQIEEAYQAYLDKFKGYEDVPNKEWFTNEINTNKEFAKKYYNDTYK